MGYKVITPVGTEPVLVAEARLQCKVDADDTTHDGLLGGLITAAREYAEHYTGRSLAPQTLEMGLDEFPCGQGEILLDRPPVTSIASIKYTDLSGTEQTVSPSSYSLSAYDEARRVTPAYAYWWPPTQCIANAVRIQYAAGTNAPKAVKAAILLHVEIESSLNPHTPAEREAMEKARDALLATVKVWGR